MESDPIRATEAVGARRRHPASSRTAHPRRDLPGRYTKPWSRQSHDRSVVLRRFPRAVPRGGIPLP